MWVSILWGQRAKFSYLLFCSAFLLFFFLGARNIWTQEHFWADISYEMLSRHDFFHPYLYGNHPYYDKPLLSYWFIILVSKVTGQLSTFELRFPSALAGVCAICSIYRLGTLLKDSQLGLLSGWLLLTTFYFFFWARTSSADMLNAAGALIAVTWYMSKRDQLSLFNYMTFFMILAMTSLCKGLGAVAITCIAVITDLILRRSFIQHLSWKLCFSISLAMIVYLLPFFISSYYVDPTYPVNGLSLVYRENILRYFRPFDHIEPAYVYLLYLPVYLIPSILLFMPALLYLPKRWKQLTVNSKWIACTWFLLFLFFTVSGSRRTYYILPVVPFVILFIADWLMSQETYWLRIQTKVAYMVVFSYLFLIGYAGVQAGYTYWRGQTLAVASVLTVQPVARNLNG